VPKVTTECVELFTANFAAGATGRGGQKPEAENIDARGHVQKSLCCQGERRRDGWEEKLYKFLLYHSLSLK
jgi:hypothetical protein